MLGKVLIYSLIVLLCMSRLEVSAQTPTAIFSVPTSACMNENLGITNSSINADSYAWDFCADDFSTLSSYGNIASLPGISYGTGFKLVEDNAQWYAFAVGTYSDKLFRMQFGNSPLSSPQVTDLGDATNALAFPQSLDLIKHNGNWYGILTNYDNGAGITLLSFGSSLSNDPTSQFLGTFGATGKVWDAKVVKQGSDIILAFVELNTNKVVRVNFRDSFTNSTAGYVVSSVLTGPGTISGLDVVWTGSKWKVWIASTSTNEIFQYDFDTDLMNTPVLDGSFSSSIPSPYRVDAVKQGSEYFVTVTNDAGDVRIFNCHALDFSAPPTMLAHTSMSGIIGLETFRYEGRSVTIGVGTTSNLKRAVFESQCGIQSPYVTQPSPSEIRYETAGIKLIELSTVNANGFRSSTAHEVAIANLRSPEMVLTSANMCVGNDVRFFAESAGESISTYQWSFGDQTSISQDANPVHQFSSPGNFEVTLSIVASNGCKNSATKLVTIYDSPIAEFQLPEGSLCTNNEFKFINSTIDSYQGNLAYQWYVDGTSAGTNRDLTFTFNTAGVKTVKLVTSIPGCMDDAILTTPSIQIGPVIDFSWIGNCEDSKVSFKGQLPLEIVSFYWELGNEIYNTTDVESTFDMTGEYPVLLSATNSVGCVTRKIKSVKIYSKPNPDFTIEAPPQSCSGRATDFINLTPALSDSQITLWRWNFGDENSSGNIYESQSPSHMFASAGLYNVELKAKTDKGCEGLIQKQITIAQSPSVDFSSGATCLQTPAVFTSTGSDIKSYYWEIGTSYYLTKAANHTFNAVGEQRVKLTVTGTNNCISASARKVMVPVPLSPSVSYWKNCVGAQTEFSDNTTGNDPVVWRQWNIAGAIVENVKTTTFTPTNPDVLPTTLTVKGESGCTYSKRIDVTIWKAPVPKFNVTPSKGAIPLEVHVENTSEEATKFSWTFEDGAVATSTEKNPVYSFTTIGEHSIQLKAANAVGCESISSKTIEAQTPSPDIEIKEINLSQNPDKTLKVIVTVQNNGNTVIKNVPVLFDMSGQLLLREVIAGPLYPSELYNLVLSYGITKNKDLHFLCAETDLPDDLKSAGNRSCIQFEKDDIVLSPYPNPASETLNIEWISPTSRKVVLIIADSFGKALLQNEIDGAEGLNQFYFDVRNLKAGIYFLVINDGSTIKTQRILISPKN